MKQPVYKGPKKHHAAVFISQRCRSDGSVNERIRIIYSDGYCVYSWYNYYHEEFSIEHNPCWFSSLDDWKKNFRSMRKYDRVMGRKTFFIGYVRDTELE